MKTIKLSIALLFVVFFSAIIYSCMKEDTIKRTNPNILKSFSIYSGMNQFYTKGVHSLEELDALRADPSSPVYLLTENSYTLFRADLQFYKDVTIGWRHIEIENELNIIQLTEFYQTVMGINPPEFSKANGNNSSDLPILTCYDKLKYNGGTTYTKTDCDPNLACTCCYIRKYEIDIATL